MINKVEICGVNTSKLPVLKNEEIDRKIPGKPRLHPVFRCSRCDEQVMQPWAKEQDGEILCPRCGR